MSNHLLDLILGLHVTSHLEFTSTICHLCVQEAHYHMSNHTGVSVFWIK